jgi:hypothetical protein
MIIAVLALVVAGARELTATSGPPSEAARRAASGAARTQPDAIRDAVGRMVHDRLTGRFLPCSGRALLE